MTDDRSEMEAARLAGLAKRHEQRLENATYTAAEVKVLTEAALRLGRKEAGESVAAMTLGARHADCSEEGRQPCSVCWALGEIASRTLDATNGRTDPNSTSAMLKSLEGK